MKIHNRLRILCCRGYEVEIAESHGNNWGEDFLGPDDNIRPEIISNSTFPSEMPFPTPPRPQSSRRKQFKQNRKLPKRNVAFYLKKTNGLRSGFWLKREKKSLRRKSRGGARATESPNEMRKFLPLSKIFSGKWIKLLNFYCISRVFPLRKESVWLGGWRQPCFGAASPCTLSIC